MDARTTQPQHLRYRWPADVNVEQSDLVSLARQSERQLRRYRALAHTTLARKDENLSLDTGEPRLYEW